MPLVGVCLRSIHLNLYCEACISPQTSNIVFSEVASLSLDALKVGILHVAVAGTKAPTREEEPRMSRSCVALQDMVDRQRAGKEFPSFGSTSQQ